MANESPHRRRQERLSYTNLKEQSKEEVRSKFVEVPVSLKGHVIGKGGCRLREIRETTGANISSQSKEEQGFTISGDEKEIAEAERLIMQIVSNAKRTRREVIKVEEKFKPVVIGRHGAKLQRISKETGATGVFDSKVGEICIISGTEEQREHAKVLIGETVALARIRGLKSKYKCRKNCYIDEYNLSASKLKLEQVMPNGGLPARPLAQYQLKPAKEFEPQEQRSSDTSNRYKLQLMKDVLASLRKVKQEMSMETPKADMWCHFGKITIQVSDRENIRDGRWSIAEAMEKFDSSHYEHYWKSSFNLEGVNVNERPLKQHYKERFPEEIGYVTRYDITFLSPCWHQLRCKVWVAHEKSKQRLEDLPVPFGDVKNILGEIQFKEEKTRSRCRGWLVFKSRKYLQVDILFPGCEFDCRFHIRGRTDGSQAIDYAPDESIRDALLTCLSGLRLTDDDSMGLHIPEADIPEGFHVIHKRCSTRTEYTSSVGFTIILSKERAWSIGKEGIRETTDVLVHYKEWDTLLGSGIWEPEAITEKLPEFLEFVKEVQAFLFHDKIPPDILARGSPALEAYVKALSDGKTFDKRVPLMLIGQHRAGKTSLMKSLKGLCFDPQEASTVGIEVDPAYCKVSTETWKTGTSNEDQNSDTATYYYHHTARYIKDDLQAERKSAESFPVIEESYYSNTNEMLFDSTLNAQTENAEIVEKSREAATLSGHGPDAPPPSTSTDLNKEQVSLSATKLPEFEEVAAVTESFLRGDLEDNRDDIYFTFWDFAGQSVFYVTHPLFLTSRAIYCLVYDLSLDPQGIAKPLEKEGVYGPIPVSVNLKTNLDYLDFWMTSVASLASNEDECCTLDEIPQKLPPVILVCTHADMPFSDRDPSKLSLEIFGYLKGKPYAAHLWDVFVVDNTSLRVKNYECAEVVRLRRGVLALAKELPHVKEPIPIKWLKFENVLQGAKKKGFNCISLENTKQIALKCCSINEDEEFKTMANFFHDIRSMIHFDDTEELEKLVILNPQWLVDIFKKVITIKRYTCEEKKFLDLWCKLEKTGIIDESLLAHVWGPLFKNEQACESLIEIMKKFCLLCSWPPDGSGIKSYLVPSMLRLPPPKEVLKLVESSTIPSLFIKFDSGIVPVGFFPRLFLQFYQWGQDNFWRAGKPQLFHNFARFYTTKEDYSIILICHSSTVEVIVHGGNSHPRVGREEDLASKLKLSVNGVNDDVGVNCCRAVIDQLGLTLECMRHEFHWLRNMKYEMSVICTVCCTRRSVGFCQNHNKEGCTEEQCLHFWSLSTLRNEPFCTRHPFAVKNRVQILHFLPWFSTKKQQEALDEHKRGCDSFDEENEFKALDVPVDHLESLLSGLCDSKQIVCQFEKSLQLTQSSLEQPDPKTKRLIRCLARKAKSSERRDVFDKLRKLTPAGTVGPWLCERLDVREIENSLASDLTVALSGGDEWKLVAEKLGLNQDKIRFLDKRGWNPADELLCHITSQRRLSVGELYDILYDCGLDVIADKL